MSRPPTATVVRYVRRLDRQELTELLVALHRESGHEVHVADGVVVARRGGSRTTLLPVAGADAPPVEDERAVSVVVTTGDGTGRARDLADQLGAEIRTAADLVEMLFYAVDRDVTVRLCEEFLGRPPGAMRPPPIQRLQRRLAALGENPPVRALGVVLILAVCVVTVAVALPASPDASPSEGTVDGTPAPGGALRGEGADTPTPAGDGAGADAATPTPSRPPGVGPDGSVDAWALAVAHHRVLRTTDFRLERRYTGPEINRGTVVGNRTSQYRLVTVSGGTHFARWRTARCDGPEMARERYFDGTRLYEVRYNGTNRTAGTLPLEGNDIYPRAAQTSAGVVRRHLDTASATAAPVPGDPMNRYRIVARGAPRDLLLPAATNYTARAVVRPSGVVERLQVSYRTDDRVVNTSLTHSFVFESPGVPPWYRELSNATDENGTVESNGSTVTGTPFSEQIETVTQRESTVCPGSNDTVPNGDIAARAG